MGSGELFQSNERHQHHKHDEIDGKDALQASSTCVGNAFYRGLAVTHPDHSFFEDVNDIKTAENIGQGTSAGQSRSKSRRPRTAPKPL
jgi:hypothetical protein